MVLLKATSGNVNRSPGRTRLGPWGQIFVNNGRHVDAITGELLHYNAIGMLPSVVASTKVPKTGVVAVQPIWGRYFSSSQAGNVGTQTLSNVSLAKDVVGIAHDRPLMAVLTKRATHPAMADLIRLQHSWNACG
jgi:hypothetical protein